MQHFLLIAHCFICLINYYPGLGSSLRLGAHTSEDGTECVALLVFHGVKLSSRKDFAFGLWFSGKRTWKE